MFDTLESDIQELSQSQDNQICLLTEFISIKHTRPVVSA